MNGPEWDFDLWELEVESIWYTLAPGFDALDWAGLWVKRQT